MSDDGFIPGLIVATVFWLFVAGITIPTINDSWRQQIVDHGCAGWYLDSNSKKQWNWSKKCTTETETN